MTAHYLSRADYAARISDYKEQHRKNAEAIRTQPSVWYNTYGFDYACWASHPKGIEGPQLPAPWRWNGEMWYCRIQFCTQLEPTIRTAQRAFGIQS